MTKEESIKILKSVRDYMSAGSPIWDVRLLQEAIDNGINALEDDLSEWGKERIVESFGQKYVVRDCIKCGWHGAIGKMKYCPNCGRGMVNWNV